MAKRRFFSCSRCEREIELDDGDGLQTKECSGCGTWIVIKVREGRVATRSCCADQKSTP